MIRGRDEQTRECGEKPPASVDKTLANKGAPNLSVKPVQHHQRCPMVEPKNIGHFNSF